MHAVRQTSAQGVARRTPTLSPTRIATYLECLAKYRYIYFDKIGRYYMRATPGLSFGSTLHHVLQAFYGTGGLQSADEMVAAMEMGWIGAGYATPEQDQEHRRLGRGIVEAYHEAHLRRMEAGAQTIAVEKMVGYEMGRFRLVGRIDRLDRYPDGRIEIVDYKSGREDVSADEVGADLAMSCYQLIVKRMYPESRVYATIYCLRSGRASSAEITEPDLARFEDEIREIGNEIIERDYSGVVPLRLPICTDCVFLSRCARYWKHQERSEFSLDEPFYEAPEH